MAWFASPKTPVAHEAFSACERLDLKMEELRVALEASATLLDAAEYERVVREHATGTAEARRVREHFEQTAESTPVDGKDVNEAAYRRVADLVTAALSDLEPLLASLRRYANAKSETEYAAGQLTNDIAHAHTLVSTLPEALRPTWQRRLSSAQSKLHEAADKAKSRRWLEALDMVETITADVHELTAGAKDTMDARTTDLSVILDLTNQLAGVRNRGREVVAMLEQAQPRLSDEGYKVAHARVIKAGQRLQTAQVALDAARADGMPGTAVAAELTADIADIGTTLQALAGELDTVLDTTP